MLSNKKESFPDNELLNDICNALIGRLQSKGYRTGLTSLTSSKIAAKMRRIDDRDWFSEDSRQENLRDLENWAIKQLVKDGQIVKAKRVPNGPTLKYPNALTWVTSYDDAIQGVARWIRECVFGQTTAPFDRQKFQSQPIERARSKAIQWVKKTLEEERGKLLTFEREQWATIVINGRKLDADWFKAFSRNEQMLRDGILTGKALEERNKTVESVIHMLSMIEDGLQTFDEPWRTGGIILQLYYPNGELFQEKVPHGGKLAWFAKWSGFLAQRTGWWSNLNAMDFVLTNMPATIGSPVVGSIEIPKDIRASLHVPGARQDCRFLPYKVVLTIQSPASDAEVIAEYHRIINEQGFTRHKLSDTGAALLELYYLMPPPATWGERLEKWEEWRLRHPQLKSFPQPNAEKKMRKEWERATNCASWRAMSRKPIRTVFPAFISPPPEPELLLDDE